MKEILKIHKNIPRFGKVLEDYLRTNYPKAEIKKGRRENTLMMKISARERLTIRFESDSQQQTTTLSFLYRKWVVRGIRYGVLGVWPTPVAITGYDGFEEELAEKLGRYLGIRFWAKTEILKPNWVQPDTFFCVGALLMGALFFGFYCCFDFARYDSIWWFSGWCKRNAWLAFSYSSVIWILFFYLWYRKKKLPWLSYVISTASCLTGWLSLSTAYNIDRLDNSSYLSYLLYFIAFLVPFVMGIIVYKQSQKQAMSNYTSKPLFNP